MSRVELAAAYLMGNIHLTEGGIAVFPFTCRWSRIGSDRRPAADSVLRVRGKRWSISALPFLRLTFARSQTPAVVPAQQNRVTLGGPQG